MNYNYTLFIDDEREPVNISKNIDEIMIVVRSSAAAIDVVRKLGSPKVIQFDHDLGGDDTSIKFINWFTEQILDGIYTLPKDFEYNVHSQNPIGAKSIESKMDQLIHFYESSYDVIPKPERHVSIPPIIEHNDEIHNT